LHADTIKRLQRQSSLQAWKVRVSGGISVIMLGGISLLLFATAWISDTWLCRIGCALAAAGYFYTTLHLFKMALVTAYPANVALHSSLAFYRDRLKLRRDALASCFNWGILPSAPGVVLALLGWVLTSPAQWSSVAAVAAFWAGINLANWRACSRQAAQLHDEIELLDAV
jgi:hypothetical protein